jgi:hypothetical protein
LAHRGSLVVASVSGCARWRDEVRGSLSKAKIRPRIGCGRCGRSRKHQSDRKQQEFSHGKDSLLPVARGATTFAPLIALTLRHDRSVNPFATIRVPARPKETWLMNRCRRTRPGSAVQAGFRTTRKARSERAAIPATTASAPVSDTRSAANAITSGAAACKTREGPAMRPITLP